MMCTIASRKAASAGSLKGTVLGTYKTGAEGTLGASVLHGLIASVQTQDTKLDS